MYHEAHRSPQAGIPPLVQSWAPIRSLQAIERFVLNLIRAHEDRLKRRGAIRDLQRFDDRVLRDLGIERGRIPEIAAAQAAAGRR